MDLRTIKLRGLSLLSRYFSTFQLFCKVTGTVKSTIKPVAGAESQDIRCDRKNCRRCDKRKRCYTAGIKRHP